MAVMSSIAAAIGGFLAAHGAAIGTGAALGGALSAGSKAIQGGSAGEIIGSGATGAATGALSGGLSSGLTGAAGSLLSNVGKQAAEKGVESTIETGVSSASTSTVETGTAVQGVTQASGPSLPNLPEPSGSMGGVGANVTQVADKAATANTPATFQEAANNLGIKPSTNLTGKNISGNAMPGNSNFQSAANNLGIKPSSELNGVKGKTITNAQDPKGFITNGLSKPQVIKEPYTRTAEAAGTEATKKGNNKSAIALGLLQGAGSIFTAIQGAKAAKDANKIQEQSLDFQKQTYLDQQAEKDKAKAEIRANADKRRSEVLLFRESTYGEANNRLFSGGSPGNYSLLNRKYNTNT